MNWTTEKPTVPGWYWAKWFGIVAMVEIRTLSGWGDELWIVEGRDKKRLKEHEGGQWAGPLQPPGDAHE